ncbi:MAG: CBS domain-containing protein, partial [Cyanobacteria bacterium P01_H01_bin.121]
RRTVPFILGKGSVENALEHLKVHQQAQMYIVDRHNHPVGFVDQSLLQEALNQGKQDMSAVMRTDFPKAETSNSLEDIFHLCEAGVPVAITSDGKFNGVVEQSDVFASIGRLTETPEASPVVEREPQQVA